MDSEREIMEFLESVKGFLGVMSTPHALAEHLSPERDSKGGKR